MRSVLARRILVTAALVGACALCFGRLTIHPGDMLVGPQREGANDLTDYFQPLRIHQIESWQRYGQIPAWDMNLQLGRPTAGNPQSSLFYPPNWLYMLLGTAGIASWIIVLHHLFAGWGMYLLCRRRKFCPVAATVGAIAFMAAPYLVAQSAEGHYAQICVAAWIPWALLGYQRLRVGKAYSVPLMALALTMAFFCGHAQELYYLVVVLSLFWVVDLIRQGPDVLPRADLALRWVGVGCLTLGLVACEIATVYLTSREATRGQGKLTAAMVGGAAPANLLQLANPFILGTPHEMLEERNEFYWETLVSFGVAPLLLAVAGIALAWRLPQMVRYAVLLIVALIFALGDTTPLYTLLHNYFPGVSMFRVPSRIMFIASAAVAVLAAAAVHQLVTWPQREGWIKRVAPALGCLLAVTMAAELAYYGIAVTRTIPPEGLRQASPLTARLQDSVETERVLIDQQLLSDGEARRHNIAKVRGYDPFYLVRHSAMVQAMMGNRQYLIAEVPGYATDPQLNYAAGPLQLMGVRYAAAGSHNVIDNANWRLVERGELPPRIRLRGTSKGDAAGLPYSLYEFQDPLPRAYVLGHTESASPGVGVIAQLSRIDPRRQLLVSEDPLPEGPRQDFMAADVVEYTPSRVVIDAELEAPGFLVLAETYSKGWTATANGQPATISPVNIGFRGVPLSPGKHRVEFAFRPPLRNVGLMITAMSLVVAGLLLWNDFRPDPTSAAPEDDAATATDNDGGQADE